MRVALLEQFDFVASVGSVDDALGADRVALARKAVVSHLFIGVRVAGRGLGEQGGGSELGLGVCSLQVALGVAGVVVVVRV